MPPATFPFIFLPGKTVSIVCPLYRSDRRVFDVSFICDSIATSGFLAYSCAPFANDNRRRHSGHIPLRSKKLVALYYRFVSRYCLVRTCAAGRQDRGPGDYSVRVWLVKFKLVREVWCY